MNTNRLLICLLLIVLFAFPVLARNAGPVADNSSLDEAAASYNRLHNVGALWMTLTSGCSFGNDSPGDGGALIDPCTGEWSPQGEFPGGTGVQYLFEAGLWVGALVQENSELYPRVSTAVEGWFANLGATREFWSSDNITEITNRANQTNCLGDYITSSDALTDQEFMYVAYDTFMTVPGGRSLSHPVDGPHFPLGLKVSQHTYSMATEEYSNIIFVEYTIRNVGDNILKNPYVGLYYDGDVGIAADRQSMHFADDITGFINEVDGETVNVAYIADNDGRRNGVDTGTEFTCPDVVGVKLFDENNIRNTSYNWWISNGDPSYDFGPSWTDDDSPGNWTDTLGTPIDDAAKYFLMSNGEFDYDQVRTDDSDWIEAHPQEYYDDDGNLVETHSWRQEDLANAEDIANGFDTRFLISWGPFGIFDYVDEYGNRIYRLNPGEETSITIAFIAGRGFHNRDNPQDTPPDIDPSKYDMSDLIEQGRRADYLYGNLETLAPPPVNDNIQAYSGYTGVILSWDGVESQQDIYTNIYRDGADTTLNTYPITNNMFVDTLVTYGEEYSYRLQRVKNDTILSAITDIITVTFGAPERVLNMTGSTGPGIVDLSWNRADQQGIEGYNVLRSTRTESGSYPSFEIIATVQDTFYTDNTMDLGEFHKYAVQAVRNGLPGVASNEVILRPFSFTKNLLILSMYTENLIQLDWKCDEVNEFYYSTFNGFTENIDTMSVSIAEEPPTLNELADYRVVWLNTESDFVYTLPYGAMDELIEYMDVGGRLIVSGIGFSYFLDMNELKDYLGFQAFDFEEIPTRDDSEDYFYSAISYPASGYPDLIIDEASMPELFGYRLGSSTTFSPTASSDIIYTYSSSSGESSMEDEPIGILFNGTYDGLEYNNAILGFSLYATAGTDKADVARNIYTAVLNEPDELEHFAAAPGIRDDKDFHVYPNPFNAISTLEFHLLENKPVEMKMFNVLGQVVYQTAQRNYQPGSHKLTIDGSNLSTGLYFIQMSIGQKQSIQKLLLVK